MNGLLVINKPLGITSMDVIRKIRKLTQTKKVGHNGTLDPLATGILLVCIGTATKQIKHLMGLDKTYTTTIDLSAVSDTEDLEGTVQQVNVTSIPTIEDINAIIPEFLGTIIQTPPQHSAVKIAGQRSYKKARDNKETFIVPPRMVTFNSITITDYKWPHLTLDIDCQTGAYIRSLGRDIGKKLGVGGYLTKLERTSIGSYTLKDSYNLNDLSEIKTDYLIDIEGQFDKRK